MKFERVMVKSKITNLQINDFGAEYGSIKIDSALLQKASIAIGEIVKVYNNSTSEYFEAFVTQGKPNEVSLGCGKYTELGNELTIISYMNVEDDSVNDWYDLMFPIKVIAEDK